jgi:cytochrome oxidase Cu insertion factor (SCO1/SenC/PrrC family)
MSSGVSSNNPIIVAAFHSALLRQSLVVLGILALLALCWNILRAVQFRRAFVAATALPGTATALSGAATGAGAGAGSVGGGGTSQTVSVPRAQTAKVPVRPLARADRASGEPVARRFLRIVFGCLWLLDGVLQLQSQMPGGMPGQVIEPTARLSPSWVQHIVNFGVTTWTRHPIAAASSAVWIQVGLGALLLVAPRGRWSRAAGLLSVGWGLIVWVFGESFGGVFGSGTSFLFGVPGAVFFYCVAGALIALPERFFVSPPLGRVMLRVAGIFLVGMAILEAWPGRGFWDGQARAGTPAGPLTTMAHQMSHTPQPALLSSLVAHFGSFDASHGWVVNLFASLALGVLGLSLVVGRPARLVKAAVVATVVFCLADWVFVQDLGFFGGTGTDPNSMIPFAALLVGGYLATVSAKSPAAGVAAAGAPSAATAIAGAVETTASPQRLDVSGWRESLLARPAYLLRTIAAAGMIGVILVGAAPMAVASVSSSTDPIIWQALNGPPQLSDFAAPPFSLLDQQGRSVSLSSLHGHVVALTFLDPVCTTDCPLIAQEFRQADEMLGSLAGQVEMVAIVANPQNRSLAATRAFDQREDLETVANWIYLTGSRAQLSEVWSRYGIEVQVQPGGGMVAHNDVAFVIDRNGHLRVELGADPGDGTAASKASFAGVLASQIRALVLSG